MQKVSPVYKGIMLLGAIFFLISVVTGIWRIAVTRGFPLPPIPQGHPPHGNLMLGGFLASLIMFERMSVLPIGYLVWVPYVYSITAVFIHMDLLSIKILHVIALIGWLLHRWYAFRVYGSAEKLVVESIAFITLSLALIYPGGLAGSPESALAGLSFAVSIIAHERIEMSLGARKPIAKLVLYGMVIWNMLWVLSMWVLRIPILIMGVITLMLVVGVVLNDIGLHMLLRFKNSTAHLLTSSHRGNSSFGGEIYQKFMFAGLVIAYYWLFTGCLSMFLMSKIQFMAKDILYHSIGLGFIFTMIMLHAPMVMGATLGGIPGKWRLGRLIRLFFIFQFITMFRIAGDMLLHLFEWVEIWRWTGWISGFAHLIVFVYYITLVRRSLRVSVR
jgi:hypothetical protein